MLPAKYQAVFLATLSKPSDTHASVRMWVISPVMPYPWLWGTGTSLKTTFCLIFISSHLFAIWRLLSLAAGNFWCQEIWRLVLLYTIVTLGILGTLLHRRQSTAMSSSDASSNNWWRKPLIWWLPAVYRIISSFLISSKNEAAQNQNERVFVSNCFKLSTIFINSLSYRLSHGGSVSKDKFWKTP